MTTKSKRERRGCPELPRRDFLTNGKRLQERNQHSSEVTRSEELAAEDPPPTIIAQSLHPLRRTTKPVGVLNANVVDNGPVLIDVRKLG